MPPVPTAVDQHLAADPPTFGCERRVTKCRMTSMWSAAVLEPAFPGRSIIANDSPVPSGPWSTNAHSG